MPTAGRLERNVDGGIFCRKLDDLTQVRDCNGYGHPDVDPSSILKERCFIQGTGVRRDACDHDRVTKCVDNCG